MSERGTDVDTQLIELLYDEMEADEMHRLREALESDPEMSQTLADWTRIQSVAEQLNDIEPDPQSHYNILREARLAASESHQTSSFWSRFETLFASPAFAVVAVAAFAGTLFSLLTDDIQDDADVQSIQPTVESAVDPAPHTPVVESTVLEPELDENSGEEGPGSAKSPLQMQDKQSEYGAIGQLSIDNPSFTSSDDRRLAETSGGRSPRAEIRDGKGVKRTAAPAPKRSKKRASIRQSRTRAKPSMKIDTASESESGAQPKPVPTQSRKRLRMSSKKSRRARPLRKGPAQSKTSLPRNGRTSDAYRSGKISDALEAPLSFTGDYEAAAPVPFPSETVAEVKKTPRPPIVQDDSVTSGLSLNDSAMGQADSVKSERMTPSGSRTTQTNSTMQVLTRARRARSAGRHRDAVRAYETYLSTAPDSGAQTERALYEAAQSYRALGRTSKANQLLRLAAQGQSDYARRARLELSAAKDKK